MNKDALITEIALKTKTKKKDVASMVECMITTIHSRIKLGEPVDITGLIKFTREIQAGKTGKIPGTENVYTTEDKFVPKAKVSQKFKDNVKEIKI